MRADFIFFFGYLDVSNKRTKETPKNKQTNSRYGFGGFHSYTQRAQTAVSPSGGGGARVRQCVSWREIPKF